jgi:hypothetical protein
MQTKPLNRIPMSVKLLYTAFMCLLVPVYWKNYGWTNFLYFCDVALFMTLAAVWLEKPILASMPAVGILLPQALWCVDFLGSAVGLPVTGMTGYMFDSKISWFARGLSFFHFWLPFLLVFLVYRLGYDRRAFRFWTYLAIPLVLFCFWISPVPPAPLDQPGLPVNINYVHGINDQAPQTWMHPYAWLGLLLLALPCVLYAPAHWVLSRYFPQAKY